MVYGESRDRNNKLREFKDGKLKLGPGDLIPVRFLFIFYFENVFIIFVIIIPVMVFTGKESRSSRILIYWHVNDDISEGSLTILYCFVLLPGQHYGISQ